jgi:hypothetical protein
LHGWIGKVCLSRQRQVNSIVADATKFFFICCGAINYTAQFKLSLTRQQTNLLEHLFFKDHHRRVRYQVNIESRKERLNISVVPCGTSLIARQFPAMNRRAIFDVSLRDICLKSIIFSSLPTISIKKFSGCSLLLSRSYLKNSL